MEKVNIRTAGLTILSPNLMVIDCENEKVIFAHGINIGYITPDKIFYVKKDYFEGGGKHTVFMGQYIKVIEQTYQLNGSITEERVFALQNSVKELDALSVALNKEKDPTKVKAIVEHAVVIVKEFANEPNKKRFAAIEAKANSILNPPAAAAPVVKVPTPIVKAPIISPAPKALTPEEKLAAAKKNALLQFEALQEAMKNAKKKKDAKIVMTEAEKLNMTFESNFGKDSDIKKSFNAVKRTFSKK